MGARAGLPIGRALALALSAVLALGGCGLTAVEEAREEARTVAREAEALRTALPDSGYVTVRRVDRPWVGIEPIEEDRRGTLPRRFLAGDAVTLPLVGAHDEAVLAARIEAVTGLAVRFVGAARESAAAFAAPDGLSPSGSIWTGPLDRLLDAWVDAAGHEWRFDADARRIEIVRARTAVFRVNALAGSERHGASSSTQDQAGEDGSASLSAQSIESETVYDPWPEIEAQIAGLVGEETKVTVSPASASVSRTSTRPAAMGTWTRPWSVRAWLLRSFPGGRWSTRSSTQAMPSRRRAHSAMRFRFSATFWRQCASLRFRG